jgi:hypothetical protein
MSAVALYIFIDGHFCMPSNFITLKNKIMGLLYSKERKPEPVVCEVEAHAIRPDEFEISLDAQAFEFHMLSPVKIMRVTRLDLTGRWGQTLSNMFTREEPYEDEYVKIVPNGSNGSNTRRTVKVTIKEPDSVQLLYQSPRLRPRTILCHRGEAPVVYVQMTLKRQNLPIGTFEISESAYLLCGNSYILIMTLPDDATTIRPTVNQLMERSSIDPSLLFFASQPLPTHQHHQQT